MACAKAARLGDLNAVDAIDLGAVYKWKLAFLYQDRKHPSVLPVYKADYLRASIGPGAEHLNYLSLYPLLLKERRDESLFEFGEQVWARAERNLIRELSAEEAFAYFQDHPDQFRPIKEPSQDTAGFSTLLGRQLALVRDRKEVGIFLSPGEWINLVRDQMGEIQEYPADKQRHSGLAENAPELALGRAALLVRVLTKASLIALCDAYSDAEPSERAQVTIDNGGAIDVAPLNQILFGPPGTGKTYATVDAALEILDRDFWLSHTDDRAALKSRFDELMQTEQIRFVTFHQSFSYEDFVEGLRAETDEQGTLRYEVVPGVFKSVCDGATNKQKAELPGGGNANSIASTGTIPFNVGEHFGRYIVQKVSPDVLELEKPNGNRLPIGMSLLMTLAGLVKGGEITIADIREGTVFEKVVDSKLEPYLVNGYNNILPALVERLSAKTAHIRNPSHPNDEVVTGCHERRVLIIDEINRGNVSRIFGELITLIEPSKRQGSSEALEVILPYSKMRFSVPSNVYLIGTMNTADRSLAAFDVALRRRFTFKEMLPLPSKLLGIYVEGLDIAAMLKVLNQRIEVLLDREHCLGHAYLLQLRETSKLSNLASIFRHQIIPLLQEYFFNDWEHIRWVLNDHRKLNEHQFVVPVPESLLTLFGESLPQLVKTKPTWQLNPAAFEQIESYAGIIKVDN